MTSWLQAYATYLPVHRLDPREIGARGVRVAASFDEDSTTMAVAAAAALIRQHPEARPATLHVATTSPPYLDKTNASAVHAALHLSADTFAGDVNGSARAGFTALRVAISDRGLAVAADVRVGKPGSIDEKTGGDGAVAVLFGDEPGIAEVLAQVSRTDEFLDRWREATSITAEQWEERFGFERYAALVQAVSERALDAAGIAEADHVVVTSPNSGVVKKAGSLVKGTLSTGGSPIGHAGAADIGLALAGVLDVAGPGETILLISAADGCDALVLRTTESLASRRQARPVEDQLEGGRTVKHLTYLAWRGLLDREMPRRPEPDRPAGPPSARGAGWKFGFAGSRCTACGFLHLPPARVCRSCGATDEMTPVPVSRLVGRVATYTVDRLAYSPSPPVVDVVVDFDGGGRCALEVADADEDAFAVGTRVDLTFRRFFTAGGVHNYFWKARALPAATTDEGTAR